MATDFLKAIRNAFRPGTYGEYLLMEMPKANWKDTALNFAIILASTLAIRLLAFFVGITPTYGDPSSSAAVFMNTPLGIVFIWTLSLILIVLTLAITHAVARLLGGKGGIKELAYLYSLANIGLFPVSFLLALLTYLPLLPIVYYLFVLGPDFILGFYMFFLLYKIIKSVYQLSTLKAVAVIILQIIITGILYMLVMLVVFLLALSVLRP